MDSSSGKYRRRSSKRPAGGSAHSSRRSKSKRSQTTQSFTPPPAASHRIIRLSEPKGERPIFKIYLAAFVGVFLLVLLGGGHNAIALGVALLLPGIALLLQPPTTGLGKWADWGIVGLLGSLLLAFIPQFYWPQADWRLEAVESFGIALPPVLSVQPWISFEAWLMALAGFAWLYAAVQWQINLSGRRRLFFCLSVLIACLAGIVVWGNLVGARYPGAEGATAFSFFPNRNQTANFLALGGIAALAYAMEGVRTRQLLPLMGVPASALCLVGLVLGVSRAGVLLYFLGVGLWFIYSLWAHSLPRFFKLGLPIMVVAFSLVISSNERTVQRIVSFVTSDAQVQDEFRLSVYQDTTRMVLDAPVSGFGLAAFPAVFPQYRDGSANHQRVVHPESDLFWLASEGGLLAVACLALFLFGYALRCRGLSKGAGASYRVFALIAVIIFLLHALIDVPGHRPGTVYFAILFGALALPKRGELPGPMFRPFIWRVLGVVLVLFGLVWMAAGAFKLPWHSSVRGAQYQNEIRTYASVADFERAESIADAWLALRPLDWRAYFQRAQLILARSGQRGEAAADFRRARFVEPILGVVSYEEGKVWLPYDPARAVSAWRETLFREMDNMDRAYSRMLAQVSKSPDLLERMARMSEIDPHYRAMFLQFLRGDVLNRELQHELSKDPGLQRFNRAQRTAIVRNWVERGAMASAESFLSEYGDSLADSWWLWSLLRKDQADFEAAVGLIREHVEVPSIPEIKLEAAARTRLMREYAVAPKDIIKGTALLSIYVQQQAYEKALPLLDRLLEAHKPPMYLDYWRAECLYQLGEYIESWYAFESYLQKYWAQ